MKKSNVESKRTKKRRKPVLVKRSLKRTNRDEAEIRTPTGKGQGTTTTS